MTELREIPTKTVRLELHDVVGLDLEPFYDKLSRDAIGSELLQELDYRVIAVDDGMLIVEVSGFVDPDHFDANELDVIFAATDQQPVAAGGELSTPDEIVAAIDGAATRDERRAAMWALLDDILDSVRLADPTGNSEVWATVEDYVVNHYGDD